MRLCTVRRVVAGCLVLMAAAIVGEAVAQERTGRGAGLLGRGRGANARSMRPNRQDAQNQRGSQDGSQGAAGEGESRSANKEIPALNWDAAPVDIVLQAYADQLDKTYLKDPAVPNATITLKSREGQKLTQEEYLEAIEVVLEMNGIHLEPYGEKFVRVLPRKEARKEGIPLIMNPEAKLGESGRVVSMMIQFKNIGTEEAQKALEGFKSNNGILLVFERTNSILVTDTEQNINRMLEISRTIDIASPVLENVFVRQIKNASAADIKTALEAIVQESQKELEKSGKNSNISSQNDASASAGRPFGSRLLGNGPNRQNSNQPAAPSNQPSLVMTVSDADRGMIRGKVLILADERSNKLIIVTQKPNMDFFDRVIEQLDVETTPDTVVKVYRLKYAEAEEVSDMINDLIGNASSKSSGKENSNRNAKTGTSGNMTRTGGATSPTALNASRKSANQRTGEAKAGELTKDNTTVLADKRINGLVVMTEKELVPTLEQIIESMDVKLSQVLIETVIIEVTLGDGIESGIDWIQKGRQQVNVATKDAQGRPTFYAQRTTTTTKNGEAYDSSTSFLSDLVPADYSKSSTRTTTDSEGNTWVTTITDAASKIAGTASEISTKGLANYYTAGTYGMIAGGSGNNGDGKGGSLAYNVAQGITSNVFGKALNFVFDSDELGIAAVLQATKTDSHSKYLASPIIMTVDNKEATIEATEMRYLFKGYQYSGSTYNGSAVPDYEQKEVGTTIKVTPKINPNGTVMLNIETEYSIINEKAQVVDGVAQDTTTTRKMSADTLLENNQTVVLGGLTETSTSESETGIPILKDIPWIGKWLFGSMSRTEGRKELLIFMTPYVLDEGAMAQAEALRRKRSLSDSRPWEDNGWSLSELADPVSKKEQMRRIKEEWKKQDEERASRIAIETEKVNRVKQLEKLSKEERELWLKMHKEELDREQQAELEEKMLDKDSQEELKKLAANIRQKKVGEADAELKKAEEEVAQDNERAKLDRERAKEGDKKPEAEAVKPEVEVKPEAEEASKAEEAPKAVEAPKVEEVK